MLKRITTLLVASVTTIAINAQELIDKVSDKAVYVMTINGGKVLEKVSQKEIDESLLFSQISRSLFGRNGESKSLKDLGVDLKREMVFATEYDKEKEIIYGEFFYPIEDRDKFGKYIQELWGSGEIIKTSKYYTFKPKYGSDRIVWNKDFAVYFLSNYIGDKFKEDYNSYYETSRKVNEVMDEYTKTKDFYASLQKIEQKYKELDNEKENEVEDAVEEAVEVEETVKVDYATEAVEQPAQSSYKNRPDDYYDRRREAREYFSKQQDEENNKLRQARRNYINTEADKRLGVFFDKKPKDFVSIASNNSYQKSVDASADATMWFKNDVSKFFILGSSSYRYGYNNSEIDRVLNADIVGETVAKLYFEKDKARIDIDGDYGKKVEKVMTSVFNKSINTNFFNYLNDDLLGYFSISGSTENFFNEIPGMYSELYQKMYPKNETEISLAADMFSLFVDEEAIGDLLVGDAIFVLNGIKSKEVTYTTYEYDENYNLNEVEKTKKELVPDFLFMIDSRNEKIINKIFKLGVTKKGLATQGNYFVTTKTNNDLPIKLFMAYHEEIFFVSTQENEIKEILAGVKGNLSKAHKDLLQKNTSVMYFNNKKFMQQLPKEDIRNQKQLEAYNYIVKKSEDSFWTVNVKTGKLDSEIIFNIPKGEKNSAKYFLNLLNKMIEIDKK